MVTAAKLAKGSTAYKHFAEFVRKEYAPHGRPEKWVCGRYRMVWNAIVSGLYANDDRQTAEEIHQIGGRWLHRRSNVGNGEEVRLC